MKAKRARKGGDMIIFRIQPSQWFISCTTLFWMSISIFMLVTDANATTMAIASDFNTGIIWNVNLETGDVSNARHTGMEYLGGIEFDSSGVLYGLRTFPSTASALYKIDVDTGEATLIGDLGLQRVYEGGLAWDHTTLTMYGVQDHMEELFIVDLITGQATIVTDLPISDGDFSGISFDSQGDLYLLESTHNNLWKIDKFSGDIFNILALSTDIDSAAGMDFDPVSGTMYVIDGPYCDIPNHLYKLDLNTGNLTLIGVNTTSDRLTGLTIIPEPATLILVGLGGLVLIGRRDP
jgi:hypothetical protein